MIDTFVKFEECINNCLLSKLFKPSYEKDYHSEYQIRYNKLDQYFPKLFDLVENVDFRQQPEICSSSLYSLLILYMELKSEGPWNTENIKAKDYPGKLNQAFKYKYNITFEEILLKDDFYKAQEVFDKCIKELHQKMTLDDFKKYPGLIEVYCLFIKDVKKYNVTINPVAVLPVAFLLVDDYIISNKVKGLQCCVLIMQCLKADSFKTGNYYEVVYRSLKKNIYEKDIEVTKALFQCFPEFLKNLPLEVKEIARLHSPSSDPSGPLTSTSYQAAELVQIQRLADDEANAEIDSDEEFVDANVDDIEDSSSSDESDEENSAQEPLDEDWTLHRRGPRPPVFTSHEEVRVANTDTPKTKLDDVFSSVIDQLNTETNLYRKAVCFDFTSKIIEIHGVHCVKKKIFKDIICDNLDLCCNEGVYEILIQHVLECLQMWIRYSWCIWKLSTDQKILSALIKILYVTKDETTKLQIQNLILTVINLCTKEEKKQICSNLESVPKGLNNDFLVRINLIKEKICT